MKAYLVFSGGGVNCHDFRFIAGFTSDDKAAQYVAAHSEEAENDRWAIEEIELDEECKA